VSLSSSHPCLSYPSFYPKKVFPDPTHAILSHSPSTLMIPQIFSTKSSYRRQSKASVSSFPSLVRWLSFPHLPVLRSTFSSFAAPDTILLFAPPFPPPPFILFCFYALYHAFRSGGFFSDSPPSPPPLLSFTISSPPQYSLLPMDPTHRSVFRTFVRALTQ